MRNLQYKRRGSDVDYSRTEQGYTQSKMSGHTLVRSRINRGTWRWLRFGLIAIHLPSLVMENGSHSDATTKGAPLTITVANARTSNPRHVDVVAELVASSPDVIAVLKVSSVLANELTQKISRQYPYSSVHPQDSGNSLHFPSDSC